MIFQRKIVSVIFHCILGDDKIEEKSIQKCANGKKFKNLLTDKVFVKRRQKNQK